MELLPLGTVIQVNNNKAFIIGYSSVEREQVITHGYFVASYPLGFTSVDKMVFIPHDFKFKVLAEGYKTRASEHVLKTLSKSLEMVKTVSYDDLAKFNQLYKESVSSIKEGVLE